MDQEFSDGRLLLRRTEEERQPILKRLRRIEGQVRGLQQMLQQDRYCLEELQQINAIVAAMREVAQMIASQHLAAGIDLAAKSQDPEAIIQEVQSVLRVAIRKT